MDPFSPTAVPSSPAPPASGAFGGAPVVVWTSPGIEGDAPRFRSAPTTFDEPPRSTRALIGSPLARLQPRTVGQLLDGGFEVLRFRARTIVIVGAVIVLPLYVLPQIAAVWAGSVSSGSLLESDQVFVGGGFTATDVSTLGLGYLGAFGLMLATMLLGVAVSHLVGAWLMGGDPGPADTLRFLRSRLVTALGAFVLAFLLKVAGALACGLGLLYVIPVLSVLAPVVGVEQARAAASLSRTMALARRRLAPLMGISALWAITSWVVSGAAAGAAGAIAALLGGLDSFAIVVQIVSLVATVALMAVQVSVTALVYIDLRVRTEGLDLHLESTERFDAIR